MANIFRDSAAPYVLAILVGALSWLLNSAITELKNTRYIEYQVNYTGTGKTREATVTLSNRSMGQSINVGKFGFECLLPKGATGPCLRELPENRMKIMFMRSGTISLLTQPELITDDIVAVNAAIPPRAHVTYRLGLANDGAHIRVGYDLQGVNLADAGVTAGAIFVEGPTVEGFVLQNYLKIIIVSIVLFILCFIVWIIISIFRSVSTKRWKELLGS